jgi:parvulin-like peptidyl-prolyl isomerase
MKPPKLLHVLLSLALLASPARGEILERVIAKVNGDVITQSEFEARQVAALQAARVGPDGVERFLRENNARILQEAIDDLLLVQRAAELGLRLRPEYIKEVIEGIKKENNIPTDEALDEQLRREGLSVEEFKRDIHRSVLRRQVIARELEPKASVSEAEALAAYERDKEKYTRPATVHLQEILTAGEDALARAREIAARARAGEDFAALAREHSAAPTRSAGGELGRFARGELHADLDRVAFALAPGEVSEPIPSGEAYRILKLVERIEAAVTPFEELKVEIARGLQSARMREEYERYLESLRKQAIIDIRVREVPLQVELPAQPSILEPPAPPSGAPPASEFTTTGSEGPEKVAPPPAPEEKEKEKDKAPKPPPPR